jgi:N-acetylmuramoyl-L-alanine amidase
MLAQPAVVQQAYLLDAIGQQPARLVVDLVLTSADEFANPVAAASAAALAKHPTLAAVTPPPLRLSQDITASTPPATPPAPQASRPLIVIDPGHGGIDNGASAPNGVHEKDIVLAFALDLQQALIATGRYDVALTREDDTYLTLNERVALARQNKADLFISVHADTFQDSTIRGASIYTRDENATDILDKVLADNENKSDIVAGFAAPDAAPAVVDILVDLMRRQMRKQSYMAAGAITRALQPSVDLRRFPVRQADFFVLQAPDVPSILIELGFLSNPQDVANLQKNAWRDRVVEALTRGIDGYFTEIAGDTQTASPCGPGSRLPPVRHPCNSRPGRPGNRPRIHISALLWYDSKQDLAVVAPPGSPRPCCASSAGSSASACSSRLPGSEWPPSTSAISPETCPTTPSSRTTSRR